MISALYRRVKSLFYRSQQGLKSGPAIYPDCDISPTAFLKDVVLEDEIKIHNRVFLENSSVGRHSYITQDTAIHNAEIGKFCSIGQSILIGMPRHPVNEFVSTHPAFFSDDNQGCKKAFITHSVFDDSALRTAIGNDVWVGNNVLIPGGISIGSGAVVGCGAVVTKNVPPYAIVAGNPARVIRYRFDEREISLLMRLNWWDWPDEKLKTYVYDFHNLENLLKTLKVEFT